MVKARQGRLEPIRFSPDHRDGKEVAHLSYLDGKAVEFPTPERIHLLRKHP